MGSSPGTGQRNRTLPAWALGLFGLALVVATFVLEPPDATGAAAVVTGSVIVVLALLLPVLEGQVSVGPGGLQVVLKRLEDAARQGQAAGLDDEEQRLLVGDVFFEEGRRALSSPAAPEWSSHIDELIREIQDTRALEVEDVPDEALATVRSEAANPDLAVVEAQRRVGRGAPRWHLKMTDESWWVVSHTRHGWNARPLEPPTG